MFRKRIAKGLYSMNRATWIFILMFLFTFTACVSVNLGAPNRARRAEGISLRAPSSPFTKQSRDDVDAAWKNESNGNVISYISDCQDPSDPPLDSIVQGVLSGLNQLEIDSRETVTIQGREGRRVSASGKVDGVPSKIDLLVFKRNTCIYVLSYVGVSEAFAADRARFQSFVEGFRAP